MEIREGDLHQVWISDGSLEDETAIEFDHMSLRLWYLEKKVQEHTSNIHRLINKEFVERQKLLLILKDMKKEIEEIKLNAIKNDTGLVLG